MMNYMNIYIMLKHMTCLLGFHISVIYCRIPYIHAVDKTLANTFGMSMWDVSVQLL